MNQDPRPIVHILGSGAIGLLCAMDLKNHGFEVCLLTRPGKKINKNQLVTLTSNHNIVRAHFTAHPADSLRDMLEILIVCVKAHQLMSAMAPCIHRLTPNTVILLLVNGMGVEKALLQHYPQLLPSQIFHGVNTHAALMIAPFWVEATGKGHCHIGSITPLKGQDASALKKRCRVLLKSSFFSSWKDNIIALLWQKLIINAAINPLSALLQCENGQLLEKDTWAIVSNIIRECCRVCRQQPVGLSCSQLEQRVRQVCIATRNNYSSMAQDLLYNRITEIDYINGYLLRNSQRVQQNLPYNQILFSLIKYRQPQAS